MSIIQELSPHLADLIAAGEVVERPSSVAKELIENSIDAGATRIQVEIENGGITYLRIMDNGCGMTLEDAPMAFRRHATSKLRTEEDLSAIGTLGFRGEALAAIAAVSKIDLFTKQAGTVSGYHLHLEAGEITEREEAGCPDGTTIVIRDLFYNTPARMKFLKKDFTEAGYIAGVVQHAALSHPEIAFTMIRDGKQIFFTTGDGKLLTPVHSVFGRDITTNMVEIKRFEHNAAMAWGYVTKPHLCRPNRSMQHFFVNGRYIKSKLLQAALEEAFRNRIITGKYPSCALFIQLPLNLVDVNVHPAKVEVKFAQEKMIFETVYIACKTALESHDNTPVLKPKNTVAKEDNLTTEQQYISEAKNTSASQVIATVESQLDVVFKPRKIVVPSSFQPPIIDCDDTLQDDFSLASPEILPPVVQPAGIQKIPISVSPAKPMIGEEPECDRDLTETEKRTSEISMRLNSSAKVIGEAFHTYIVAEDEQGLILLDKHAAHERILFNKLQESTDIPSQQLLTPCVVDLTSNEFAVIKSNLSLLEKIGFDIELFGYNSFAVREVPGYIEAGDIREVLAEVADKLLSNRSPTPDRFDDLIHTVACKAAIKAGSNTSMHELQNLCDRVLGDPNVMACPHGRPVTVRLTKYEIDKLFKRVNQ